MRETNLLDDYPQPKTPRYVGPNIRTIRNKINASYRNELYYDGDRNDGYGGYSYDGRWRVVAQRIVREYGLHPRSSFLQLGCEKGFLLHDFHQLYPQMRIKGLEISLYPIKHSMLTVHDKIALGSFTELPFANNEFDFIAAIGVVYTLNLRDVIACLKEIQRVGKGKSFITLGAFNDDEEFRLFRYWSVLGATILHVDEWRDVLSHVGYTGDYSFVTAKTLNLVDIEKKPSSLALDF